MADGNDDVTAIERDAARLRSTDPPASHDVTLRPPLLHRLESARGRVVVVNAPSGYGKTTTIAAWARSQPDATAWIELDVGDNDPGSLLAVITDGLASVTDFEWHRLPATQGSRRQYSTRVAPVLGRLVGRCSRPFVLVLDDVHVVEDSAALDLLGAVVRHAPSHSSVVLLGREVPKLPLGRLRGEDRVVDIDAADLALDVRGAKELFASMEITLHDDVVDQLIDATEGWPVGLRLAALALEDDGEEVALPRLGHDEAVSDYVTEEWLRGLAPDDVDFLLDASCLDSLSMPFCSDVLERSDCGEVLHRLHVGRRLVIPLGRRGSTYRMHRLLRLVLLAELDRRDPERRRAIERRASDWCERAGDIDAAVRYALGSNDPERAERLVATHGAAHITRGRHLEVRRWIDAFGHDYVVTSASLCLMNAAASTGLGESETTRVWLQLAEEAASRLADAAGLRACVGALRAITATAVDETVLAEAALAHDALPPGPWHAVSAVGLGQLCFATGQRERAIELFDEAAAEGRVAQAVTIEVHGRASLAVAYWEAGDSRRATEAARAARALVREHRFDDNPTLILATGMSALVEAAARSMESARADIALTRHNLAYISSVGTWANVQTRLALARASLLVGDHVGATTFADEAEALLRAEPSLTPPEQLEGIHEQLQAGRAHRQRGPSALTTAEMRVLHYLPTNLTLTEIARRLFVSRNTAKSHTASVYRKLGASSRGEAVEIARTVGLLPSFELDPTPS